MRKPSLSTRLEHTDLRMCPLGCEDRGLSTGRVIEKTEPDVSGEYKEVCTCDRCEIIFYVFRSP